MKQSTLMFVAIASILCFPTLMKAQENEPCIVRSRPANTELSNILQFRYMWLYSKAFPDDSRYVQHIHSTQDAFGTEITESMKLKLDAHRMRFVIYDGASYNAKTKQLNVMQMLNLPSGSFVEQVEDFTLCNPGVKPFPAEGIYQGTEFTIMLPSTAYSWDYTDGFYGAFTAYGYYYIDPIGEMFASPPPTTNDTGMNGRQGQFNGNISGVLGNFNMGWGYFQAFVPRGGHVKKLGIFDTGVDTLHRDMNQLLIDTAESYSIPTSNRDIRDYDGHGTRSMSCMAARGNNLYGMTGADINDTVVVYKVWSTTTGPISAVSTAINMSYTAHVTDKNFSLGSTTYDPTLAVNIANGYSTYNSWSYAAAGNSGSLSNTTYPAC